MAVLTILVACGNPAKTGGPKGPTDTKKVGSGATTDAGSGSGSAQQGSAAVVLRDVGCPSPSCVYHAGTAAYFTCTGSGSGNCTHFGPACTPANACMYEAASKTYKQCTIRHAKAGQLDTALWWANRGVAVYGADAHDESWVNDLRGRASRLQEKVRRPDQPKKEPAVKRGISAGDSTTTETLTCLTCGKTFERARTRGRKPHHCPQCRSA